MNLNNLQSIDRKSDLCFCRRIDSRAFISILSKCVTALTQCFTLPFVGNSGGNKEAHKMDSTDSGLHQIIKQSYAHLIGSRSMTQKRKTINSRGFPSLKKHLTKNHLASRKKGTPLNKLAGKN